MRLIDADETIREIVWNSLSESGEAIEATAKAIHCIENMPSIERKKGKWHQRFYPKVEMMVCSECDNEFSYDAETGVRDYNFCPNCGADMRGENNETN